MIYLSASSIRDYLECPARYFYRINCVDDGIEIKQTKEMLLGSIIHKIIEMHWDNSIAAYNELDKECRANGIEFGDEIYLRKCLSTYFNTFISLLKSDDRTEEKFKIKLDNYKDVVIVGRFDRISSDGIVIDWKSGKVAPANIDNDVQFIIYDYAYSIIHKKNAAGIFYASLSSGKLLKYNKNNFYYDLLFNHTIPQMIVDIRKNSFPRVGVLRYGICNRCLFKDICFKQIEEENELASKKYNNV